MLTMMKLVAGGLFVGVTLFAFALLGQTLVDSEGGPKGDIPEVIARGPICNGDGEWRAHEGDDPDKVKAEAERIYTPEKCAELKTCEDSLDVDCPRLTD